MSNRDRALPEWTATLRRKAENLGISLRSAAGNFFLLDDERCFFSTRDLSEVEALLAEIERADARGDQDASAEKP